MTNKQQKYNNPCMHAFIKEPTFKQTEHAGNSLQGMMNKDTNLNSYSQQHIIPSPASAINAPQPLQPHLLPPPHPIPPRCQPPPSTLSRTRFHLSDDKSRRD